MSDSSIKQALSSIDYWLGVYECVCHAEYPIGGCLFCDLTEIRKLLENLDAKDKDKENEDENENKEL